MSKMLSRKYPNAKAEDYHYSIVYIGEKPGVGYKAVIPKFPKILIMADAAEELPALVKMSLEMAIEESEETDLPLPPPDFDGDYSGNVMLRIEPALHEHLVHVAKASGKSLNSYIKGRLEG